MARARFASFRPLVILAATLGIARVALAQPAPPKTPQPPAAPTPKDAAEAEAKPTSPAPASTSEPLPDPTPGPDPFHPGTPWSNAPTSVSGTQLVPSGPTNGPVVAIQAPQDEAEEHAHIRELEARVAELEENQRRDRDHLAWLWMFKVSGYLQPQLLWQSFNAAASPNNGTTGVLPAGIGANDVTAKSDGTTTNPDFFRMRRARMKIEMTPSAYAKAVFEIDPNLSGGQVPGSGTIARNIEAIGIVPWTHDVHTDFGVGIFKVPFSHEIVESDADRPFIERSFGEGSMFPSEFDTGARAYTRACHDHFLGQLAVVNGSTLGEKNFTAVPDLNKGKDFVARINHNFGMFDAGVGGYYGQGQTVDATALRFKQYPRKAIGFEAGFHHTFDKSIGQSRAFFEFALAQNMDRGARPGTAFTVPAIPAAIGTDIADKDERSWQLRVEQDVTRWVTLGVRYDAYAPDTAQADDQRQTLSFVSSVHFTKALQWMLEFDHAIDHIHAPNGPVPNKQIETLSNVLQVRF